MAFEELLQLLSRAEAVDTKLEEVMSLLMLSTAHMLASEEVTPGDPEWKAIAARAEEFGAAKVGEASRSAEMYTHMAAEMATKPGGEAVAEVHRRMAASAVALGARAQEFAAFMRDVGALTLSDSAGWPAVRRCRKPNARYFGPEWSN